MRKFLFTCFFSTISAFGLFSCGMHDIFQDGTITETKMVEALQEALVLGSKTAAFNLGDSSCESNITAIGECATGYLGNKLVEILLPDTVKDVLDKISSFTNSINSLSPGIKTALQTAVGTQYNSLFELSRYGDSIKVALNRGAERAAPASVDVFKKAIFGMSFSDAREVLLGNSTAATSYLHTTTYDDLQEAFSPFLEEPLNLLNPNKYWRPIVSNYNSFAKTYSNFKNQFSISSSALPGLPYEAEALPGDISAYLANYATGKALDGLFLMVGKQETKLRADPWGTVSSLGDFISDTVGDLLSDVFGKAKDGSL